MSLVTYGSPAFIDALFASGAVGFKYGQIIRFKSGILSPGAYINNRVLQSYPDCWRVVADEMVSSLSDHMDRFDTLAAVATGGIAHGALLSHALGIPMVTIKKEEKTSHGLTGLIDGDANVLKDADVFMVEDMSSTFESTMRAMDPVEDGGAYAHGTIVINTWNFPEFEKNTQGHLVLAGCTGAQMVREAARRELLPQPGYKQLLLKWLQDPRDDSWITAQWK